jgi:hypothetical protein
MKHTDHTAPSKTSRGFDRRAHTAARRATRGAERSDARDVERARDGATARRGDAMRSSATRERRRGT